MKDKNLMIISANMQEKCGRIQHSFMKKKKTLKVSIKRMYLLTYQTTLYDKSTAMLYPKGEAEPFL